VTEMGDEYGFLAVYGDQVKSSNWTQPKEAQRKNSNSSNRKSGIVSASVEINIDSVAMPTRILFRSIPPCDSVRFAKG